MRGQYRVFGAGDDDASLTKKHHSHSSVPKKFSDSHSGQYQTFSDSSESLAGPLLLDELLLRSDSLL